MKRVSFSRHVLIFILAFAVVINMVPIYGIQAANAEGQSSLIIQWEPAQETLDASDTGSVILTAALQDGPDARAQIKLSAQEAAMLFDFWDDDGSLKENVTAETGQALSLRADDDGNYILEFSVDENNPNLSATLSISAKGDNQSASAVLEVSEDDISAICESSGDTVPVEYTGGTVTFNVPFGWTADIGSDTENPALIISNGVLQDYTAGINIAPIENQERIYTKSQEINISVKISGGGQLVLPEGRYECIGSDGILTVTAEGKEILSLTGISDENKVTVSRTDAHTLSLTITRTNDDLTGEDLSALDILLQLNGEAIKTGTEIAEDETITISGEVISQSAAGTSEQKEFFQSVQVQPEAQHELPRAIADQGISGDAYITLDPINVYWVDNNDEEGNRPGAGAFMPKLCFTYVDENGEPKGEGTSIELTEENMSQFGLETLPEVAVTRAGTGRYTVSVRGELPTTITNIDEYGDVVAGYPKYVSWELEAPDIDGYSFQNIVRVDEYPSADPDALGWYYILYDNFTITFNLRSNSFVPDHDTFEQTVLDNFTLFTASGHDGEPTELRFAYLAEQGRFSIEVNGNYGNSGTIHIRDLWRYNLDGTPIIYNVKADENRFTVENMEDGDYYSVSYDNTSVPNYGASTDAGYSGGMIYLTLTGTTDYEATKVWLDPDGAQRPKGEVQLWRYREGSEYSTAAPVRDSDGDILTITLNGDDSQTLEFPVDRSTSVDGLIGALPKYDLEGHRYIYAVREYLDGTTAGGEAADSYEQVFGSVDETGKVTDTLPDGTDQRASGNMFVYDNGTLSNRISGTVDTNATKTWKASAFQSELGDVTVQLTLQSRAKGDDQAPWQDVKDDNGDPVQIRMDEFIAETLTATESERVSRYSALGEELEYRWIESGVYQGDSQNLLKEDGTFTLEHSGRKITYQSYLSYSDDGLETYIINRIVNTIDYDITKVWRNADGEETDAPDGAEATFVIYQTLSGEELSDDKIIATVTMDGEADDTVTDIGNGLTFCESEPWTGKVDMLPEFSENGAQYEYTLMEAGSADNYFPTYETIRSEEDHGYDTVVTNQPGSGNRIMVRKDWVDNGDVEHRGIVTIEVYDRRTSEKVGETTLGNGVWTDWIGIGELEPEEVYILETTVETDKAYDTGAESLTTGEKVPEAHQYETDNHRYEVTYAEAERIQNDVMYSVENRRLGNIDFTVTKTWNDGSGNIRRELRELLVRLPEDEKITPALRLEFSEEDSGEEGYSITYNGIDEPDMVSLGGSAIYIENKAGGPESSVQKLDLSKDEKEYYFHTLPKYDTSGDIAHYSVREVWVLESDSTQIFTLSQLASSENEHYREIYDLIKEYSASYGDISYEVSEHRDSDKQSVEIVNSLSGSKNLNWNKEWHDAYNVQNNLRPDIYLDIYRVGHTDPENPDRTVTELYLENYRWIAPEEESYDWQAILTNVPKYDERGYEFIYYAVERTSVDGAAFDYLETAYKIGDEDLGTELEPSDDPGNRVIDISALEGNSDGAHYALIEGGTFVNRIQGQVSIRGYKIWRNLPTGYDVKDLPGVTFRLMQSTDGSAAREVATLTIEDWEKISINGRYTIGFDYYGVNTLRVADGEIYILCETGAQELEKYDENGNLYTYTIEEKILWADGEKPPDEEDGNPVFNMDMTTNTYQMTNGYVGVQGNIHVNKLFQLPMDGDTPEAYPAVTFELSRTYVKNNGYTSEPETVEQKTISSAEVRDAYEQMAAEEPDSDGKIELATSFDDVPRYAPNGSEYEYTVTEVKTNLNGYDTWARSGHTLLEKWDELTVDANKGNSVSGITALDDTDVDATFANAQPQDEQKVTLSGRKNWNDYEDAFGLRPDTDEFADSLTLYRSAARQPGQNNSIAETEVPEEAYIISVEEPSSGQWTYKIEGKADSGELERNAPNGMSWRYVVRENLTGSVYAVSPASAGQSGSADQNGNITISGLTNSIQTSAAYNKRWIDDDGTIGEDYLGADITVEFTLQVAETDKDGNIIDSDEDGITWNDAEKYFEKYLSDEAYGKVFGNYSFTSELTGRINSDIWNSGGAFSRLPKVIVKGGSSSDQTTYLTYRAVESSIEYGGHTQTVTVQNSADSTSYSYEYGDGLFSAGQDSYASNSRTAVNKLETVDFTVTKQWAGDNGNVYGSRPETGRTGYDWEISFVIQRSTDNNNWENVQLYTGTQKEDLIVTIYGGNSYDRLSATIEGLPSTNMNGQEYMYRARELQPGYQLSGGHVDDEDVVTAVGVDNVFYDTYWASYADDYQAFSTVATNSLSSTKVYAKKIWIGDDTTPLTLTLQYLAEDGKEGKWTDFVPLTVIGREDTDHTTPYYEYEASKSVWKAVWEYLPLVLAGSRLDEQGHTQYRVKETVPSGFDLVGSSKTEKDSYPLYSFTNVKTVSLTVQKNWSVTDQYTLPADGVRAGLYRTTANTIPESTGDYDPVPDDNGKPMTLTLEGTSWRATAGNLPKYDADGNRYIYFARELNENGQPYGADDISESLLIYHTDTAANGNSFTTAVRNVERIDINGTKTWADNSNLYGTRPSDITLTLTRSINGVAEEEVNAEPTWTKPENSDVWSYSYTKLPYADENGKVYTYTVTESVSIVSGEPGDTYTQIKDGYDFTNRLTGTTEVTGTKTWIDDGDGTRPDELTLTLSRKAGENGEKETVTGVTPIWSGTDSDTWTYRYEDLPKYDENGVKYIYSVEEAVPDGYGLTDQSGYELTNTQLTSVDVQKIWGVNAGDTIPEYVTIGLYRTEKADGTQMEPVADENGDQITLDLRNESGWQGTFDDLLKYDPQTRARYYYGIAEIYVSGGDGQNGSMGDYIVHYGGTEEDGFIVTNITPIAISGTKTWLDNSNAYGTRLDDLELTLYRSVHGGNEEVVEASPEWTKDADQWTYRYIDLPLTDDAGNVYTYRVEEIQAVPGGSAGEAGDTYEMSQDGFDFTNVLTGTTEVTGTKTWRDNGRTQRGPIVLTLYANGEAYDELTLEGEGDVWEYAFTELPKYDENGAVIEYTVRENDPPEGYDVNYTEEGIENIQKGALILEKTVTGTAGETDRKFSFTITLSDPQINGVYGNVAFVDGKAQVTLSHGESVEIYGLPAYVDYTVVENGAEADGYTVTAEGDSGTIQPGENSMISFENHKDKEPAAKTGDGRELTLYSAIAVISAMTAAILLVLKKRVK